MSLVKAGQGIVDIRGSFGGVYFTRDKSGLHQSAKPRTVHRLTAEQRTQRNAFRKARAYTKDPRWVSYYIYRALNNLPFVFDAVVTRNPTPDSTGRYELTGTYDDKNYYRRTDQAYSVWWSAAKNQWFITPAPGVPVPGFWFRINPMTGTYAPGGAYTGTPAVALSLTPPPADYQIPKL